MKMIRINPDILFCAGLTLLLSGTACAQSLPSWYLTLPDDETLPVGRGMAEIGHGGEAGALAQAKREAMP